MSCAGNGYLTGNMSVAFPFEDGGILAWTCPDPLAAQMALQRCFVDAGIYLEGKGLPVAGLFSIDGGKLAFSLSDGETGISLSAAPSGERFPVMTGRAPWGWYTIVMSSEGIRDFLASGFSPPAPGSSSPSGRDGDFWMKICARCVSRRAEGLTSLRIYDGVAPGGFDTYLKGYSVGDTCYRNGAFRVCVRAVPRGGAWNDQDWDEVSLLDVSRRNPDFVISGDIKVVPGNNMLLSEPEDGDGVGLEAIPGAGMGKVPCSCESGTAVSPALASPDGHVRFFNDTCYDIEPRIFTVDDGDGGTKRIGVISMHAKCTACCTCDMYASIVNDRLVPISNDIREARSDLSSILRKYEEYVDKFNRRLVKPELSDITMSLSGFPIGAKLGSDISNRKVTGKMQRCAFTAVIRNSSFSHVVAVVNSLSGSDSVVEASVAWADSNGDPRSLTSDSAGGVTGKSFDIYPGKSLAVTFISVKKERVQKIGSGRYTGRISVSLSYRTSNGVSGSLGNLVRSVVV